MVPKAPGPRGRPRPPAPWRAPVYGDSLRGRLHAVEQPNQFRALPPKPALDIAQGWSSSSLGTAHLLNSPNDAVSRVPGPDGVMLRLRTPTAGAPSVRAGDPAPPAARSPAVRRGRHIVGFRRLHHGRVRAGWVGVGGNDQQNQPAEPLADHRQCVGRGCGEPSRMMLRPLNSIRNDAGAQMFSS